MSSPSGLVDIKEKIWNGTVNLIVKFQVRKDVKEFLITAYRNSYFPVYYPVLIAYFLRFQKDLKFKPVWLEFEEVPLKWNISIGVLYDHLYLPSIIDAKREKPWTLSLKYGEPYPSQTIIPFHHLHLDFTIDYEKSLKQVLMNQLKQSCFVLNGNSKAVLKLSEEDTNKLFDSIKRHNLKDFEDINKKMASINRHIQRIPTKIYYSGTTIMTQAPVYAVDENNDPTTLRNILEQYLSSFMDDTGASFSVYCHGIDIEPLLDEHLVTTWELFRNLDNFLYIVVLLKTS